MWAITSYYNPIQYATKLRNFRVFQEHLKVPLIVVEFSREGVFELDETLCDIHIKLCDGDVLWQKEALLNVGIKHVPAEEDYVTLVDADVLFTNLNWVEQTEMALQDSLIVQPFSQVRDLDKTTSENRDQIRQSIVRPFEHETLDIENSELGGHRNSFAKSYIEGQLNNGFFDSLGQRQNTAIAPGFSIAGKKKFFEKFPLFDEAIIGGGDSLFWDALAGEAINMAQQRGLRGNYRERYLSWASRIHKAVGKSINYVEGNLLHLWHEELESRGYYSREFKLNDIGYDPSKDLIRSSEGIWKWTDERTDLREYLNDYFFGRKEDFLSAKV